MLVPPSSSAPPPPPQPSFGHGRTQHLRAEERAFGSLNHLLIHTLRRMVHHHRTRLVVDLGIHPRVADQVDNPLLAFGCGQAKSCREIPITPTESVRGPPCQFRASYLMSIR